MSLKSGYYTLHIGNNLVGRSFKTEDCSLLPKPIYNATDDTESTWQIESLPGGMYRLRNFDAPIAAIEGRLEAIISPDVDENEETFEWLITPESHHGEETLYTIMTPSGDAWHTTSDKFSMVVVGPMNTTSSDSSQPTSKALVLLSANTLKSAAGDIVNDDDPVGSGDDYSVQVPRRKAIFNATHSKNAFWNVQAGKDGKYKLLNLGAPVAAEKGKLHAFTDHPKLGDSKFDWTIKPQFHQGSFLYTIMNSNNDGWFTTSKKFSQIKVGPLPSTKTQPPEYFPNALFKIMPYVIPSGFYTIHNVDDRVGRAIVEDDSLGPKPILNNPNNPNASWLIHALGPDRYKLTASPREIGGYNPVGVDQKQSKNLSVVSAFLDPKYIAPEWIISPQFNYGEDLYTIQLSSSIFSDGFWFANVGKEMSQASPNHA